MQDTFSAETIKKCTIKTENVCNTTLSSRSEKKECKPYYETGIVEEILW